MDEEKAYYALTRKAFDILAPFYNVVTLPIAGVRRKVAEITGAKNGSKILDVATGTGQQAFAFAKRGYDVVAVDLTESMIEIARKNNKNGLVRFEVADATNLHFQDNTFDVSCVSFALHDMPLTIREKVLKEMTRVTRPNGTIVVVDYALPENWIGRYLVYHLVSLYEGEYYSQFIVSDLEAMLRRTGIAINLDLSILLGAVRILVGMNIHNLLQP